MIQHKCDFIKILNVSGIVGCICFFEPDYCCNYLLFWIHPPMTFKIKLNNNQVASLNPMTPISIIETH